MADAPLTEKEIGDIVKSSLTFLGGLNKQVMARYFLADRGYTDEVNALGWKLALALLGYPGTSTAGTDNEQQAKRAALARIDQWDEPNFELASLALKHNHPDQYGFLFKDLAPAKGIEAVSSVRTFLTRINILRNDPDDLRPDTREADRAAVAKLEERKVISPVIEADLWKGITLVTGIDPSGEVVAPSSDDAAAPAAEGEDRQTTAVKLRNWLEEWTGTAKKVITRRDYKITLGLAKRRMKKSKDQDAPVDEPPPGDVEPTPVEPLPAETGDDE